MIRVIALAILCGSLVHGAIPQFRIEAFAGTNFIGDGRSATAAVLVQPECLAVDKLGNVYFSDAVDHRVRKVTGGIISTVAGNGVPGYKGDGGPATEAQLNAPYGIAIDLFGNVFIADMNNAVIRRVSPDGTILTVAGGGDQAPDSKGSLVATRAKLLQPRDVAVDRLGNLFISDFGAHRVYEITPSGVLSVIAGTGTRGAATDGMRSIEAPLSHPAGLAIDEFRNLYIADSSNGRVRRVTSGYMWTVVDKAGKPIVFGTPTGLALDAASRLYVSGVTGLITVVTMTGELSTLPTWGRSVAVSLLAEVYTTVGRKVNRLVAGVIEHVAGAETASGAGDGRPPAEWRFTTPWGIAKDVAGNIFVADTGQGRVRRISATGELATLTTQIAEPVALALDSQWRLFVADRATGNIYRVLANGRTDIVGQGSDNRPLKPGAMAFDSRDQLFIADTGNNLIRRLNPDGTLTLIAGGGPENGDGPALLSRLAAPAGIAIASTGEIWFTEATSGRLRKIAGGKVQTLAGTELGEPRALRIDRDDNFFVADARDHRIIRIAANGSWAPIAGSGDKGYSGDGGAALAASLNVPTDLIVEEDGRILIADAGNNRIRRLVPLPTEPTEPEGPPPGTVTEPVIQVKHAATLQQQALAPGQLALIAVEGLKLTGLNLTFGSIRAVVLALSESAATVQVPVDLRTGRVELAIRDGETAIAGVDVDIVPSAPGILTLKEGKGQAAALNEDGVPNSAATPAVRGAVISIYLTGQGSVDSFVVAEIGGYACEVVWAGPAPGFVGLWQVNLRTPAGFAPSGVLPLVLTINGVQTQQGVTVVTR